MLKITIPSVELWDGKHFINTKEQTLQLEHSLVSLSKWESKWCKPYFAREDKTIEEALDYIRCMTLTQNVNRDVYNYLTNENVLEIKKYIDAPMTATWFLDDKNKKKGDSRKQVTSELIYYWMVVYNIPFSCEKWHLNRLLTLIRVCEEESKPKKKMSQRDVISRYAALNAARRAQLNSRG